MDSTEFPHPEAETNETTQQRILDAALACYAESGLSRTRLTTVAKKAGISRPTLYKHVRNREDLLQQVMDRDSAADSAAIAVVVAECRTLDEAIIESIVTLLRIHRTNPLRRVVATSNQPGMLDHVALGPNAFVEKVAEALAPFLPGGECNSVQAPALPVEILCDWVARITLSFIVHPNEHCASDAALRRWLETVVRPVVNSNTK